MAQVNDNTSMGGDKHAFLTTCWTQISGSKTSEESEGGIWWIWILVILIFAVLIAIGYVYRDKLKLLWFKLKTKFKKDKKQGGGMAPQGPRPGMPPRPGFPPIRRIPIKAPPRVRQRHNHEDRAMSDTFKKLKEMSK